MYKLPSDLHYEICTFLEYIEIPRLAQVHKDFYFLLKTERLQKLIGKKKQLELENWLDKYNCQFDISLDTLKIRAPDMIVPKSIDLLQNLSQLDLRQCDLEYLPIAICRLKQLQILKLYNNSLAELPDEIEQLQNLQELYLSLNGLEYFPESIVNLKNLYILHATCNNLKYLPREIGKLQNLRELIIWKNYLQVLPDSIKNLTNLVSLDLSFNNFQSDPLQNTTLANLQDYMINYYI